MEISRCAPGDWQVLGRVVGAAFAADPVSLWTFGDATTIERVFTALGRHVYLPRGDCYLAGEQGGTMWLPPGGSKALPLPAMVALALRLGSIGTVRRALAVDAAMSARRPQARHRYLFAVGVVAAARGRGLGRTLLGPVLAECDARGEAVYLENSNPANTGFYMSHGFAPGDSFAPAPGCPALMPMWRAALYT